ncbi:MAG: ABC transporter ATP-binding protein [Ruminococcus sp.]|nr:ABC transporter ATP-binding protein [Ruminococcus sp.]
MKKIELNDVSVSYIVGDFSNVGLKDVIIQKIKGTYTQKEFLAVDRVNFAIEEGELLGIVGTNGAGKSTLCKVISGIMRPTSGTMAVRGNIASLLELGTGFDGDLTVKENTFLRGAMLGYTREFMNDTYKSIIEFAELEEFQDRKFSHLSSGMKSRLAFSIACLVKPEILILDEVLSVGDGGFRKKSEEKMLEIIKGGATTILVSHSLAQIRRMATKVLWLDKGKQMAFGETKDICDQYEKFLNKKK